MTLRLGEYVVRGELNNTKPFSTFGCFELAGREVPIVFELTGDCAPDLKGKRICFEAVPPPGEAAGKPPKVADRLIGVTGTASAAGWVRTFTCSTEEFCRRAKLGEAPPTTWQRHLYLEFFTQHGRTLIELGGSLLEYEAGGGDSEEGEDWRPLPHQGAPMPPDPNEERPAEEDGPVGPEIIILRPTGEIERVDPREALEPRAPWEEPCDLQGQLDAQTAAVERAIRGQDDGEDPDQMIAELELMDHLITHEDGDPLALAFLTPRRLPPPDEIPEARIEPLLKGLLAELALCGVALHVCEHFTLRETYRLLLEKIGSEWTYHPQLRGTMWAQHYMTSEYCPQCEEEFQRKYEEFNREFNKRQEAGNAENESAGEEEKPWG